MAELRAENKSIKQEVEALRKEVRSTYLAQSIPENISSGRQSQKTAKNAEMECTVQNSNLPVPKNADILARPMYKENHAIATLNGESSRKNALPTAKPIEWTMVSNKKGPRQPASRNEFPALLGSVEEAKRRVIFLWSPEVPKATGSAAQDILHSLNMKLSSLKLPVHLRLVKLGYNERGNHTGLTTEQTNAESMITNFHEIFLKSALRFDLYVKELTANQQVIGLKVHTVEIGRYYPAGGLEQIRRKIAAGLSALELPFVPR